MNRFAVLAVVLPFASLSAFGQARTFVSGKGSDANTSSFCSPTAPCRSFAAAQGVTSSNGEIVVLDTAGYGSFVISHPLSVSVPKGVYAGIRPAPGAIGVQIDTDGAIRLRGLDIVCSFSSGSTGIKMADGEQVHISDVRIHGCDVGIDLTGGVRLFLDDITVENASSIGYWLHATGPLPGDAYVIVGRDCTSDNMPSCYFCNVGLRWDTGSAKGCFNVGFTNVGLQWDSINPSAGCGPPDVFDAGFNTYLYGPFPSCCPPPCNSPFSP